MGHALTFTLQDVLIRYWRARGRDALWQPARSRRHRDQMVVERQLAEKQESRADGARKILERVWAWRPSGRHDHASAAPARASRLGARALHHGRGAEPAVRKVFVELHRRG